MEEENNPNTWKSKKSFRDALALDLHDLALLNQRSYLADEEAFGGFKNQHHCTRNTSP